MKKEKYFAIGDIYGRLDQLTTLLREWNKDNEQLILLGNYVDYGSYSKQTLYEIEALVEKYGAIALQGNHDCVFKQFLNNNGEIDQEKHGKILEFGREDTFRSFIEPYNKVEDFSAGMFAKMIKEFNPGIYELLNNLPNYHETDDFVFVHAAVDPLIPDWKDTTEEDLLWMREPFLHTHNPTNKIVVFGHTRTGVIRSIEEGYSYDESLKRKDLDDSAWQSPGKSKLGIDGGNVFGGLLLGAHLDSSKSETTIDAIDNELQLAKHIVHVAKEERKEE